jgi:hypothetical protein
VHAWVHGVTVYPVPVTPIRLMVLKSGPRADELLAALAERLDRPYLTPTENGILHIRVDSESPGGAWDFVDAGLNELDPDWPDYLRLDARPDR